MLGHSVHVPGLLRRRHPAASRPAAATRTASRANDADVRAARAVTGLVALATALALVLWTLAALGSADAAWWPAAVITAMTLVVGVAAWILGRGI
jgi:fatty acid desaturase